MSRRERTTTITCAQQACRETKFHIYTSQREYTEIHKRQQQNPWKCTRHARPERVLTAGNPQTEAVLIASRRGSERLYWIPEDAQTGSGLSSGPGYVAHADDVPEGTRLIVTARLEFSEDRGQ